MTVQSKENGRKQEIDAATWNTWGVLGIQHRFTILDDNSLPQAAPSDVEIKKNKAALKEDAGNVGEGDQPEQSPQKKETKTKTPYDTGRKKVN